MSSSDCENSNICLFQKKKPSLALFFLILWKYSSIRLTCELMWIRTYAILEKTSNSFKNLPNSNDIVGSFFACWARWSYTPLATRSACFFLFIFQGHGNVVWHFHGCMACDCVTFAYELYSLCCTCFWMFAHTVARILFVMNSEKCHTFCCIAEVQRIIVFRLIGSTKFLVLKVIHELLCCTLKVVCTAVVRF